MRKWRAQLSKRVGEAIFLSAQKDYVTGDLRRKSPLMLVTYGFAAIVLATPFVVLAAGLILA